MLFKNSLKILFSNFHLVWRSILYYLLVGLLTLGGISLCLIPVFQMLETHGYIANFVELYTNFITTLNLAEFIEGIGLYFDKVVNFIIENIGNMWYIFAIIGVVLFFAIYCFSSMSIMAYCNSLNLSMGSMAKQSFGLSYKQVFAKNFKFQFINFLVMIPIRALTIFLFITSLKLFNYSWIITLVGIFTIILQFILIMALRISIFSSWIPMMVVTDYGPFKALKSSIKVSFRRFGRVFGNAIGIVLLVFTINLFVGLFTFGVGLLITIPATFLLDAVFGMVVTYEGQGMRYYVDIYNVIAPMKKERSDKLKELKLFI